MKNNKVIKLCYTAMFTAMIFVLTRFVSVPVASGYVHFGDALIYIVASTLGGPWAVFAAMVGEALADLAGGYAFYAPATLIVKALMAVPFVFVYKINCSVIQSICIKTVSFKKLFSCSLFYKFIVKCKFMYQNIRKAFFVCRIFKYRTETAFF